MQGQEAKTTAPPQWADELGKKWLASLDAYESMIASVGAALMDRAAYGPGERVVDIGCGGGGTTLEIGARIGPQGAAVGLDISAALVEAATKRARAAGRTNVQFVEGDAASASLPGAPFDRVFSRFGIMFFAAPAAAFAHIGTMLRSGGRADFAVWGPPPENHWIAATTEIVARHIELPPRVPRAPGPFALCEPDYVRELLADAGFSRIAMDAWSGKVLAGGAKATPDIAAAFLLQSMSFVGALAEIDAKIRAAIAAELTERLAGYATPGGVAMDGKAWLVTAYR